MTVRVSRYGKTDSYCTMKVLGEYANILRDMYNGRFNGVTSSRAASNQDPQGTTVPLYNIGPGPSN